MLGLETIHEMTYDPEQYIIDALTEGNLPSCPDSGTLNFMLLRARVNNQRSYEIYALETTDEVTKKSLEKYFEENPQATADMVRSHGTRVWGQPAGKRQVIT